MFSQFHYVLGIYCLFMLSSVSAQDALKISEMGPAWVGNYQSYSPAVAFNSTNNEFLIVWSGDDDAGSLVEGEMEIYGQRFDAATGAEVGTDDFRITTTSTDGNYHYDANDPDVVYNATENEYFVVWSADTNLLSGVDDEFEIFGQRINAATGENIGSVIRISDAGPNGDDDYDAYYPAVAFDSTHNRYFVVWEGDDNDNGVEEGEEEIFGQLVNASNGAIIGGDTRLTDIGSTASDYWYDGFWEARYPAVAYDPTTEQYLVAYWSDDNSSSVTVSNEEFEVFGQFVDCDGNEVGTNDFLIGNTGIHNLSINYVGRPAIASNPDRGEFLVAWSGYHNPGGGLPTGQTFTGNEIFARIVSGSTRTITGSNDIRVSDVGGDGDDGYYAQYPTAAYDTFNGEYIIAFQADDNVDNMVDGEDEIFMQRLDAETGDETGDNDLRLTFMGTPQDTAQDAQTPDIAYDPNRLEALVVWNGYDTYINGEEEVFVRYVDTNYASGLLSNSCSEWNGFLDMWNIAEISNSSSSTQRVTNTLYDINGDSQGSSSVNVLSGAQTDVLVHDMTGFTENSYGMMCSAHNADIGEVDGRMVFYRPNSVGYDFAFAVPFENTPRGKQHVPFNTYQPSLDPVDASNLAANWIQISNQENSAVTGSLIFFNQTGDELGNYDLTLAAGERRDISGHQFGPSIVGLVSWIPDNVNAHTRLRNVRYYYDNVGTVNSFDSAFQLTGGRGSRDTVYVPVDTRSSTSVIELVNTSTCELDVEVTIYNSSGSEENQVEVDLDPHASVHVIVDGLLTQSLGFAASTISVDTSSECTEDYPGASVTTMQYGRNSTSGINYVYGISAREPIGTVLRGSYNTFLGQGCSLLIGNSSSSEETVTLSMVRYDGTSVISGQTQTIPGNGIVDLDICSAEQDNAYGVITVTGDTANILTAEVIRKGPNDDYRFPIPVR